MYIARSVCKGQVLTGLTYRIIPRMPQLSERAHALYIRAHGTDRYERYSDTNATPHGARPPILFGVLKVPEFCHRPEHDVESIYWSMISALLHVRPVDDKGEPEVWASGRMFVRMAVSLWEASANWTGPSADRVPFWIIVPHVARAA